MSTGQEFDDPLSGSGEEDIEFDEDEEGEEDEEVDEDQEEEGEEGGGEGDKKRSNVRERRPRGSQHVAKDMYKLFDGSALMALGMSVSTFSLSRGAD